MGKILELFNARHEKGQMYRNVPVKKDNDEHPLNYVYPDTPDSVDEDIVLGGGSVSLTRDIDRISKFEKTHSGGRFLDKQILLQRSNSWVTTRSYRVDNVKDHVDPTIHRSRHDMSRYNSADSLRDRFNRYKASVVNIPGEFAFPLNSGKLQQETANKLISKSGPVNYRLQSRGGMLSTGGLSYVDVVSMDVAARISNKINKILEKPARFLSDARARIFGHEASFPRPELEYNYLEQVYQANKGVLAPFGNLKYGHIYFGLPEVDDAVTYRDTHIPELGGGLGPLELNSAKNLGFLNYHVLGPSRTEIINFSAFRFIDSLQRTISKAVGTVVSGGLKGVASAFGIELSDRNVDAIKGFGSKFLPRTQDIALLRNLRRYAVDIDSIISTVNTTLSDMFGLDKANLLSTNLLAQYNSNESIQNWTLAPLSQALYNREQGAKDLEVYITALKEYKGEDNKKISLGFDGDSELSNTRQTDEGKTVFKASKGYYKDWQQVDRVENNTIFRDKTSPLDTDSIDVIIGVRNEENNEVRFRAFINDISETITPSYIENKYIGRYETFYVYDKVIRDLTFSLRLQAFSEEERGHILQKMAYLTSLAYPESSEPAAGNSQGYLTPLVSDLTIGNLYKKQPCIVQSLSHTIEEDTSWDIMSQTPMSVLVNLGVRLLDKKLYTNEGMRVDNHPFGLYLGNIAPLREEWQRQGAAADARMDEILSDPYFDQFNEGG